MEKKNVINKLKLYLIPFREFLKIKNTRSFYTPYYTTAKMNRTKL